jgi:hypothetical protein
MMETSRISLTGKGRRLQREGTGLPIIQGTMSTTRQGKNSENLSSSLFSYPCVGSVYVFHHAVMMCLVW